MKKIVTFLLVSVAVVTLSACSELGLNFNNIDDNLNDVAVQEKDSLAFGAYSSAGLLSSLSTDTTVASTDLFGTMSITSNDNPNENPGNKPTFVEGNLEDLNKYMSLFEPYTSNDANAVQTETVESSDPDFDFEIHYTVQNLDGTFTTYVIYYNIDETIEEVDEDDELEEGEQPEEELEVETEVKISGKMEINGVVYLLEGKIEEEENELKTVFKAFLDENNYVKMVEKHEENETKFLFELVADGTLVQKTEIKLEEEENESKIVLKFTEGETTGEYTLKREVEEDEEILKIEYKIDGVRGVMRVVETVNEDGTITYSFFIKEGDDDEVEVEQEKEEYESEEEHEDDDNEGTDEV